MNKLFQSFANVFLTLTFLFLPGCINSSIEVPKTQLQIREFQTRVYPTTNTKSVMKALINALQDDDFIIRNADKELGFISASKELDVQDSTEAFLATLFNGPEARYKKNSIVEASINVSEFGPQTKVRVLFQVKTVDNFGGPVHSAAVSGEKFYQDFFAKVDKSIFLEREGL